MRWILVVVGLLMVSAPAAARERAAGQPVTDDRRFDSVGGQNGVGNLWTPWWVDPTGAGFVTEAYPIVNQTGTAVLLSTTVAANTTSQLIGFTPWAAASVYGHKLVRVTTTGFAAAAPWRVKFMASFDGINFFWLMNDYAAFDATSAGPKPVADMTNAELLAAGRDTLMFRGHGNVSLERPLATRTGRELMPKYLAAFFASDSAAGATGTAVVEGFGRMR